MPPDVQEFEFSGSSHSFDRLSAARLETLANWADLEHDTHWHTCLGWILMDGSFYTEAISHYHEAIAQHSQAWVALEGMARCHGEQEEYQLAIDWQAKALEALPKHLDWIGGYLYTAIVDWSSQLGNEELAFEAAQKAINATPSNDDAQLKYLERLHARGDSNEILRTIEWLSGTINVGEPDGEYTWLARFFASGQDGYGEIGKACRENNQSAWVLDVMDKALTKIDEDDRVWIKVWLPFQMAKFRYMWYDDREDEMISLAEMFLERLERQTPDFQEGYADSRKWIINKLAQLYFDRATEIFKSGHKISDQVTVFADKLKVLAVSVETSFAEDYDGFDFFRKDYPSLLWGRWLRDYKKADEKAWRKCFKVRLLEEMNSLDDDDPTNDTSGMASLAVSLFHAGNRRAAAAILAVLFKPLEDAKAKEIDGKQEAECQSSDPGHGDDKSSDCSQARVKSSLEDEQTGHQTTVESGDAMPAADAPGPGEMIGPQERDPDSETPERPALSGRGLSLNIDDEGGLYSCNNCERDTPDVAEMYFCEVCQDVNWCDECLIKVRDRSIRPGLKEHECNPTHDMYLAWPIPEEAKGLAAEYLEGGIELRREWLERLREEWLRAGV